MTPIGALTMVHHKPVARHRRARWTASVRSAGLAVLLAAALGGCSGYDVELNGGIFEAMGVAGVVGGKKKEAKLAPRPGLVVPPSTASLPVPGSAPQPQSQDQAWPVDPETRKANEQQVAKAKHEAFCAEQRQKLKSGMITVLPNGPLGSCHESIVKNFAPHLYAHEKPQAKK